MDTLIRTPHPQNPKKKTEKRKLLFSDFSGELVTFIGAILDVNFI